MTITQDQLELLKDFMCHVWHVKHSDEKENYEYYAGRLDGANIPWAIQNTAAGLMDERKNGYSSFKTLLKEKNIAIEHF